MCQSVWQNILSSMYIEFSQAKENLGQLLHNVSCLRFYVSDRVHIWWRIFIYDSWISNNMSPYQGYELHIGFLYYGSWLFKMIYQLLVRTVVISHASTMNYIRLIGTASISILMDLVSNIHSFDYFINYEICSWTCFFVMIFIIHALAEMFIVKFMITPAHPPTTLLPQKKKPTHTHTPNTYPSHMPKS